MLDSLRFVQGAVAKKDYVPELTHFRIEGGTVRGYNGMIGLCCPIDLDLKVSPKAVPFVKAIQTCKGTIQLHMTPTGRLSVKSGAFKALVDCLEEDFPSVPLEGPVTPLNGGLLGVLKALAPFIAEDASRPWARGILFRGHSAFATNNIIAVEHWVETPFPVEINIPRAAVVELIRIGEEPISVQLTETSATFHYGENKWLRTQTYSTEWPDLGRVLDRPGVLVPPPEALWSAIEDLIPFVDDLGRLFLSQDSVSTTLNEANGATVSVPGISHEGCFNFKQLALIEDVAERVDLSQYPAPCPFQGGKIRGVIVGMKVT